jgi:oligopeptide transport system substrate-binding protein
LSDRDGKRGQKANGWNRRTALLAGGAAAVGLGTYAAMRPAGEQRGSRPQVQAGLLRRGNGAEPDTLDPALSSAAWEDAIIGDLLVGLITDDVNGDSIPGMAERWETSPDGLTWTFHLREATWSDGVPLTAADFVFGWQRLLDPKTAAPYAYFIHVFKNAQAVNNGKMPLSALGVRATNARTLEITLEHPASYLLEMLSHVTCYPQPRHVIEAKGKDWARPGNYVGNGAYVLSAWRPNDHILLAKNPRFFDAANVTVERVMAYPSSDYNAALRSLRAGELDVQSRLPTQQIGWIRQNMPELLSPVPQLTVDLIAVNHKFKPFDDVRVRKAMNLVINREAITDKIIRAGQVAAYNLVPPDIANYPGGVFLRERGVAPETRIAEARKLMTQAGFSQDNPVRATYMIRSTTNSSRAVAAALQQMLAQAWINITIIANDAQVFYNRIQQHDFQLCNPGWGADFSDASNFLDLLKTGNGNNWGEYENPTFDAALAAAQREIDREKRGQMLATAERIAMDDHALMPLYFWVSGNLVRPYVKGWKSNAMDKHRTRWVSIDESARRNTLASA